MTYLWVNLAVLAGCAVVAVVCLRRLDPAVRRRTVAAAGIALAVSCVFTAVFDSLIIGAGIVGYDVSQLVGWFVGLAPVEDFAYTIAAAVVLPALWVLWRRPGARGGSRDAARAGGEAS